MVNEYIEREALKRRISKLEVAGIFTASFKNAVLDIIFEQPIADVAEVRHGKWIEKWHLVPIAWDCQPFDYENYDEVTHSEIKKYWHCSCCDYEASRCMEPIHKYCPNCGAKMDKKEGETHEQN